MVNMCFLELYLHFRIRPVAMGRRWMDSRVKDQGWEDTLGDHCRPKMECTQTPQEGGKELKDLLQSQKAQFNVGSEAEEKGSPIQGLGCGQHQQGIKGVKLQRKKMVEQLTGCLLCARHPAKCFMCINLILTQPCEVVTHHFLHFTDVSIEGCNEGNGPSLGQAAFQIPVR